jgi:hypothetical protein
LWSRGLRGQRRDREVESENRNCSEGHDVSRHGASLASNGSGPPRKAGLRQLPSRLLFGAGFRGDQAVGAVVDDELAVVFAGMLDETVS